MPPSPAMRADEAPVGFNEERKCHHALNDFSRRDPRARGSSTMKTEGGKTRRADVERQRLPGTCSTGVRVFVRESRGVSHEAREGTELTAQPPPRAPEALGTGKPGGTSSQRGTSPKEADMAGQTRGSLTVPVRRAGPMASEEGRTWRGEAGAAAAELNGQNLSEAHAWLPEEYARLHAPSLLKPGLQTPAALAPPPRPPPPPRASGPCPSQQWPIHPARLAFPFCCFLSP